MLTGKIYLFTARMDWERQSLRQTKWRKLTYPSWSRKQRLSISLFGFFALPYKQDHLPSGKNARRFPAMESSLRLGSWQRWRGTHRNWFRSTVRYCRERHRWSLSGKVSKRLVEMSSVCSSFKSPTSTTKIKIKINCILINYSN